MKPRNRVTTMKFTSICALTFGLLASSAAIAGNTSITRSFSGIWNQPDQEGQGLVLQIAESEEDGMTGAAYWFTYGGDLLSSWYLAVGPVEGDTIEMTLYEASGSGFMEDAGAPGATIEPLGSLTLQFHNCNQGTAYYDTPEDALGSGEFRIKRLTSIYRMRCSGGISDNTPADARPTRLDVKLHPARDEIDGQGKARFWERSDRSDFKVTVEGLPDGDYGLAVCGEDRGTFTVEGGEGAIMFRSPAIPAKPLLNFDPRDCPIEIVDAVGVALSSGDAVLAPHSPGPDDDDEPENDEGEVTVQLLPTGVIPGAKGHATVATDDAATSFSVKIMKLPAGVYELVVGNTVRGEIIVGEKPGQPRGEIRFRDPAGDDGPALDFDVSGELIEVTLEGETVLEALFP